MIPFTMILIVCGEVTPLVIPLFGSAITPATCRFPSQVEKERAALAKGKRAALEAGSGSGLVSGVQQIKLLQQFADFGLIKRHDKTAGAILAGVLYRPRLAGYVECLAIDDAMIRAGGVQRMSGIEVRIAVGERGGVDVSGDADRKKAEVLERRWLKQWLAVKKSVQ
jgi:hypothetical protein